MFVNLHKSNKEYKLKNTVKCNYWHKEKFHMTKTVGCLPGIGLMNALSYKLEEDGEGMKKLSKEQRFTTTTTTC